MQLPPARAPPGTVIPDVWTFTPVAASYTALCHAFLTPLLAWPRLSSPTSSVAVRFVTLKHCAGASVVRPYLPPVGRAQLFHNRSNIFLLFAAPASLTGSELPGPSNSGPSICALCVARDLGWCDHTYPRWGVHTTTQSASTTSSCSAHRLLS